MCKYKRNLGEVSKKKGKRKKGLKQNTNYLKVERIVGYTFVYIKV